MSTRAYSDAWVCVDCFFAHHYGKHEHDGRWFAGESDTPCDREPLSLLADWCELSDNTDSESMMGIHDFSWSQCDGCGSVLGGPRYRLAVWPG